jgi:hypothetical protein
MLRVTRRSQNLGVILGAKFGKDNREVKQQDEYLFRFTQKATRNALGSGTYCSLKEAERLKSVPVSGVITWYDVAHDSDGRSLWASKIYMVAPRSGEQVVLSVPPEYPLKPCEVIEAPNGKNIVVTYEKAKNIRGYVKECVSQMDAHADIAKMEAEMMKAKVKLRESEEK